MRNQNQDYDLTTGETIYNLKTDWIETIEYDDDYFNESLDNNEELRHAIYYHLRQFYTGKAAAILPDRLPDQSALTLINILDNIEILITRAIEEMAEEKTKNNEIPELY